MLDRMAESLFWLGRYAERAENHARLIDVYYHLREDAAGSDGEVWRRIVGAIGDRSAFEEKYPAYGEREAIHFLTLDPSQDNALVVCVAQARDNLKKIRERLPSELWNLLNGFYLWLRQANVDEVLRDSPHRFYGRVKEGLAAFQGMAVSIALRDASWHMMECGRYLERSENVVRLLQSMRQTAAEAGGSSYAYLMAVLKSVGGYEAYRRLGIEELNLEEVSSFLLLQEPFPRSVHYALASFESQVKAIRGSADKSGSGLDRIIRMAGKARSELGWLERRDIAADTIDNVLLQLAGTNRQLGEAMAKTFFSSGREVIA
ncbi:alpha-E domain-containing protein [Cohnella nanjingensis]|uniref:Alpha-E domain-containing protein n=1 Tax=Cohnella nanjingensis TaxID=1387779 RepID=A0A7X0RP28_9BACL|nr:alpha-E domain-containing protein [Cohnella nanjingensis]MBB6669901.1 alpha-E domain-containing protein [Cohnella nanjingensis]